MSEVSNQELCPCGSGRRYKNCCKRNPRFGLLSEEKRSEYVARLGREIQGGLPNGAMIHLIVGDAGACAYVTTFPVEIVPQILRDTLRAVSAEASAAAVNEPAARTDLERAMWTELVYARNTIDEMLRIRIPDGYDRERWIASLNRVTTFLSAPPAGLMDMAQLTPPKRHGFASGDNQATTSAPEYDPIGPDSFGGTDEGSHYDLRRT